MRNLCSLLLILCTACRGSSATSGTAANSAGGKPSLGSDNTHPSATGSTNTTTGGTAGNSDPTIGNPDPTTGNPDPTTGNPDPTPSTPPAITPPPAVSPPPAPSGTPMAHTRCGWIDGDDVSYASFVANISYFNAIHPKWFQVDPNGNIITLSTIDQPALMAAAHANHVKVMPMIDNPDAARLRIIIGDPAKITAHVQAMLAIVQQHGYDGMELDYEHLWQASDRPGFSSLMTQLAQTFHAHGYELSEALPATGADSGDSGYDYQVLANNLDVLHFMHYDFHYPDGDHMGPIAPAGWVEATFQHAQSTGHPEKFMLGVPNYAIGLNWYDWLSTGIAACSSAVVESTDELSTCSYNDNHYTAGIAPHCTTAGQGTIWFENLDSMEEKLKLAKKYGARGVTYWTVGNEISGFFDLVKRYYP